MAGSLGWKPTSRCPRKSGRQSKTCEPRVKGLYANGEERRRTDQKHASHECCVERWQETPGVAERQKERMSEVVFYSHGVNSHRIPATDDCEV